MRTVQELLGPEDLATTMIYTHVLDRGLAGLSSPADRSWPTEPSPPDADLPNPSMLAAPPRQVPPRRRLAPLAASSRRDHAARHTAFGVERQTCRITVLGRHER